MAKDNINPDHYKTGGIETIAFIKAKTAHLPGDQGYLAGNIITYVSRYADKNGLEDLKKCEWYVKELIRTVGEKP